MDPRHDPERLRLASYPLRHRILTRFSDVDSYGHINNVAIAAYYEDARAALNRRTFGEDALQDLEVLSFVVAQITIQYLAEARYPGTLEIGCGFSRVGNTSVVHAAGLFRDGVCVGLCETVMVQMVARAPAPVPPDRRAQLEAMRFPLSFPEPGPPGAREDIMIAPPLAR